MDRLRGCCLLGFLLAGCDQGSAVETCATDRDCIDWLGPGWTCAPSSVSPHGLVCHEHRDASSDTTDAAADAD